ncbi:response regulator [Phenylobacterium montanum]|uniref:Response regulator transcription factor n=1 Tax=Phenylobacterium montanum TaxID=2823693 RepID=A0A975G1F3_9CAUL|nr:response regulator transcription factor [Caulobacter sp. S6]QUD88793.1 response regulator transcription factor [Caulobacter sp. S6]
MRILLLEDHQAMRSMTAAYLTERGFVVDAVGTIEAAKAALDGAAYDAMILDLGLPDGEGLSLLGAAGRGRTPPPALILTARDSLADRIEGLNAGADDYMAKPFELDELHARLRAILRRPGVRAQVELGLGRLSFDTISREVRIDGRPLDLRRRETLVLETLLAARGRVVVRDVLEDRLYGYDQAVTPNALEAAVSRLRRALDEAGAGVRVETRRGIGYALRAETDRA